MIHCYRTCYLKINSSYFSGITLGYCLDFETVELRTDVAERFKNRRKN